MNRYKAGISVNTVSIEDVSPPREVSSAFDEVQRAEQDEDKMLEQANQYANKIRGEANGQAAQIREEAAGYKNQIVQEALGESQRFLSVYEQYTKAPDITRKRLYLETMEKVLSASKKVITDADKNSNGLLPILPLNDLAKPKDVTQGAQK
jgi:membrane protease subunit HflK